MVTTALHGGFTVVKCRRYGTYYEAHVDRWGSQWAIIGCAIRRDDHSPSKATLAAWDAATEGLIDWLARQ